MTKKTSTSAEVSHPGEHIAEELDARGWSVETFAAKSGLDRALIGELIAKKQNLTPVMSIFIGAAFGTGSKVWRNLQASWDARQ